MSLRMLMDNENFEKFFEYIVFGSMLNGYDELVNELQDEEISNLWEQLQDQVHNKHRGLRVKIEKELEREE